jgi:hypothetical protein
MTTLANSTINRAATHGFDYAWRYASDFQGTSLTKEVTVGLDQCPVEVAMSRRAMSPAESAAYRAALDNGLARPLIPIRRIPTVG